MSAGSEDAAGAALSAEVPVFSAWLRASGKDFLVTDADDATARVRFVGPFQGEDVVWDCRFVTLREAQRQLAPRSHSAPRLRNFIDIGAPGATGMSIRVGLDIEHIDHSAILKMIVMIRNYKRLKPGRHEFGEPSRAP